MLADAQKRIEAKRANKKIEPAAAAAQEEPTSETPQNGADATSLDLVVNDEAAEKERNRQKILEDAQRRIMEKRGKKAPPAAVATAQAAAIEAEPSTAAQDALGTRTMVEMQKITIERPTVDDSPRTQQATNTARSLRITD